MQSRYAAALTNLGNVIQDERYSYELRYAASQVQASVVAQVVNPYGITYDQWLNLIDILETTTKAICNPSSEHVIRYEQLIERTQGYPTARQQQLIDRMRLFGSLLLAAAFVMLIASPNLTAPVAPLGICVFLASCLTGIIGIALLRMARTQEDDIRHHIADNRCPQVQAACSFFYHKMAEVHAQQATQQHRVAFGK